MDIRVQRGVAEIPDYEKSIIVELEHEVNPEKTIVVHSGSVYGDSGSNYSGSWDSLLVLLNSKQIEVKRAYDSIFPAEVSWQVVEFIQKTKKVYGK